MSIAIFEWKLRQIEQLPESFKFYAWKCMPESSKVTIYYELKGGICEHKFQSGPRKGRINYSKATDVRECYVPVADAKQWEIDYMTETGKCRDCMGDGKTVSRIDFVNGTTEYRCCSTCAGDGKARFPIKSAI